MKQALLSNDAPRLFLYMNLALNMWDMWRDRWTDLPKMFLDGLTDRSRDGRTDPRIEMHSIWSQKKEESFKTYWLK